MISLGRVMVDRPFRGGKVGNAVVHRPPPGFGVTRDRLVAIVALRSMGLRDPHQVARLVKQPMAKVAAVLGDSRLSDLGGLRRLWPGGGSLLSEAAVIWGPVWCKACGAHVVVVPCLSCRIRQAVILGLVEARVPLCDDNEQPLLPPVEATRTQPGTASRIAVYRERYSRGELIFHADDGVR